MTTIRTKLFSILAMTLALSAPLGDAIAQTIVSTSTRPGVVRGVNETSDAFIWRLMTTQIAVPASPGVPTPAAFEGWASDIDVFKTVPPHFPTANEPHKFQRSVLAKATGPSSSPIDATCTAPANAAFGGFPAGGCIAEEVKRNRPEFDYIVNNSLYSLPGLSSAFARNFTIDMPAASISVKGDWIPVPTLLQWVPQLGNAAAIEKAYLTTTVGAVEYALVSLHVASKQNANWVWATFEHRYTPGRCDYIGCYDTFGALDRAVPPNRRAYNTQYGDCRKTPALRAMMARYGLSPVWENYCLKGTQTDFTAFGEKPSSLVNQVTEGINAGISIVAGSCISCHSYAAFGSNGLVTPAAGAMLAANPTGNPVPGVLAGAKGYDFMWGFLNLTPPPQ